MDETTLHRTLAESAGVVTLAQARALGLTATMISDRVWSGRWRRVGPRTYQVSGHGWDDEARVRAAAASTGGVAHGLTAAWWLAMTRRLPTCATFTVPRAANPRPLEMVRMRRHDLAAEDVVELRGVHATATALTVLETAVAMRQGSMFLDRMLQTRVTLDDLHLAHERNLGRTGSAAAAALLTAAAYDGDSAAECELLRLLRHGGMSGMRVGYRTHGYEIGVAFPLARVAVEVDGWAWHADALRFSQDRVRQNVLVADGWRVLRYTWHHLHDEPRRVVAEIAAAVGSRTGHPSRR